MTMTGVLGSASSRAAMASAESSSCEACRARTYLRGSRSARSRATVLRLIPSRRAMAALASPSRCDSRWISAQSST